MKTPNNILATDQLGRTISFPFPPKRIVSIVPSQTELLHYLGLGNEVVGITKFCIYPDEWFRNKTRVGGTKKLNLDKIHELKPDLIIGNKEENERSQVEALMKDYPVWMSDIKDLEGAYGMISAVGELIDKSKEAAELIRKIKTGFEDLSKSLLTPVILNPQPATSNLEPLALYLIWKDPYMAGGAGTFIDDMLKRCGLKNMAGSRYPELTEEEIRSLDPQVILLSSEPYPFKEKHIEELQRLCPKAVMKLVDGELFSWYGSRLLHAPVYFSALACEIRAITLR